MVGQLLYTNKKNMGFLCYKINFDAFFQNNVSILIVLIDLFKLKFLFIWLTYSLLLNLFGLNPASVHTVQYA